MRGGAGGLALPEQTKQSHILLENMSDKSSEGGFTCRMCLYLRKILYPNLSQALRLSKVKEVKPVDILFDNKHR